MNDIRIWIVYFLYLIILKFEEELEKRQLKRQGILERMRNKMENDIAKNGWD